MRCSHNCQQCTCTASNAHVRLQVVEYLNISGLVSGNSFFVSRHPSADVCRFTLPAFAYNNIQIAMPGAAHGEIGQETKLLHGTH